MLFTVEKGDLASRELAVNIVKNDQREGNFFYQILSLLRPVKRGLPVRVQALQQMHRNGQFDRVHTSRPGPLMIQSVLLNIHGDIVIGHHHIDIHTLIEIENCLYHLVRVVLNSEQVEI